MNYVSTSFVALLAPLDCCFRAEVFTTFRHMAVCWIVCLGRRTISRIWQTTGRAAHEDHTKAYRLFSEALWNWDDVARVWLLTTLVRLIPGAVVRVVLDDTLCPKRGAKVAFGGIFLDAVLSTKGHKTFRFGVNYVTLGLVVYLPFREDRPFCINVLWRTYEKKKQTKDKDHKTKPQLAREMIDVLARWIPKRQLRVLADVAYVGRKVLKGRAANVCVIGPLTRRAALYKVVTDAESAEHKKGEKLPALKDMFCAVEKWASMDVQHPRVQKRLWVHVLSDVCWPGCNATDPIRVVFVRDPKGHWRDEILLTTDTSLSAECVVREYLDRWYVECAYADTKQDLGFSDAGVWSEQSVQRCHPMAWFVGGLVIVWYAQFGQYGSSPNRERPWYTSQASVSFRDMLSCAKLELWSSWLDQGPNDSESKWQWLVEYVCTAEG